MSSRVGFSQIVIVGIAASLAVYALSFDGPQHGVTTTFNDSTFAQYLAKYGKSYGTKEEYELRKSLFEKNLAMVAQHNSQNGEDEYHMAINKFSDMTEHELLASLGAVRPMPTEDGSEFELTQVEGPDGNLLAGAVDWRSLMNPVRDQGNCGSCWSFATIATMEGRWAVKRQGQQIQLSEQQLVDCSAQNQACNGGWPSKAFTFLKIYGAQARDQYPYNAIRGTCKYSASDVVAKVTSIYKVSSVDAALASGPIPVYVQVTNNFRQYSTGLFNGACGSAINHAITAVGYGSENGKTYYIVRNSWGTTWGEQGYIRVLVGGNCSLYKDVYVTTN